jgi:hypothetical protein
MTDDSCTFNLSSVINGTIAVCFLSLGINCGNVKKIELFYAGRRCPGKPHPPLSPRERVVEDPVRQEGRKLFCGATPLMLRLLE